MADYAISNVPRRVVYAASGTGPYAFTFEILAASDIAVYKGDTLLTLTTDYSVTINANGTGSITLVVTAGTSNITIVGSKTIARTTDFTTGGDFFANTLNDELDAQTIFIQQVAETAERGLKAPVTDPTDINMTLPRKTDRAGKYLAFDENGDPAPGPNSSDIDTVVAIAADIQAVSDIASDVTAVADIDTSVTTVSSNIGSVNTVAGISSNVTTVAGISANVTSVAGNATNINTVAGNNSNISTVAGVSSSVSTVAGISANVTTVAGISANVTSVAGNSTNINAVAGNATNINTVAGVSSNVTTVATDIANVNTVASDLNEPVSEINTVAVNIANVNAVGADIADVNTCADNIAAIIDAPNQAAAAAASAAAAAASYDNFDDRYLGVKTAAPTLDNDGNALVSGALYFNSGAVTPADKGMYVYDGAVWIPASAASSAILVTYKYTATAGQTTFSGSDDNALTLAYTAGSIIVTLNGVVLEVPSEATASNGSSVVLATGASVGDELNVYAFATFDIANTYTQAQVDALLSAKMTGTGPAFSAYMSVAQAVSSAYTKMPFNTEKFDTNNNYDNSTYRFTPTVAGYYYVTHRNGVNSSSLSCYPAIYRNGGGIAYGFPSINVTGVDNASSVTTLCYMNGTTDYLEAYVYINGSANTTSGTAVTEFSAFLARSA